MKNDTPVDASACGGSFDIAASFLLSTVLQIVILLII